MRAHKYWVSTSIRSANQIFQWWCYVMDIGYLLIYSSISFSLYLQVAKLNMILIRFPS